MNPLFCRNLHISTTLQIKNQTLIKYNSAFKCMMKHKSRLEKWIRHQIEETNNLSRFLKEPNEHGRSPEKLLYERSLKKENHPLRGSIQWNLKTEECYQHTFFIKWYSWVLLDMFHFLFRGPKWISLIIMCWKK